jgi:hypothetical protein
MTIRQLTFDNWQFANITFCQHDNSPTDNSTAWHFASMTIRQLTFDNLHSTTYIRQLTIRQHNISPTWQFANIKIRQHAIRHHDNNFVESGSWPILESPDPDLLYYTSVVKNIKWFDKGDISYEK